MAIRRSILACALLMCAAALASCGRGVGVGSPAPDITLPSTDGRQVRLSDFSGQVVAINFFAHW